LLVGCGRVEKEIDNESLKIIVQSIVRMQKSLDSKNANEGIREVLDELATNLSAEISSQISPILQSMSSEFEGFKQWLDNRLTTFVDAKNYE
jgi:hypothetical protein